MQYLHLKFTARITQLSVGVLESLQLLKPEWLHGSKTAMSQVNLPQFTKAEQSCDVGSSNYYPRRNTQEIQARGSNFLSV